MAACHFCPEVGTDRVLIHEGEPVGVCTAHWAASSVCGGCGERWYHAWTRYAGVGHWCFSCFGAHFWECGNCGNAVRDGERCDRQFVCDCGSSIECGDVCSSCDARDEILPYDWEPSSFILRGSSTLRFGLELETEASDLGDLRDALGGWEGDLGGLPWFYVKHDGSLSSNGAEIVFHPADLDWWLANADALAAKLQAAADAGARSWEEGACGLHIHLSRDGFDGQAHLARFAYLIAQNRRGWQRVAARSSAYAEWDNFGGYAVRMVAGKSDRTGRYPSKYQALNLTPAATVELRIWRPSLAVGRVLASIELTAAAVEYARNLTARDMSTGAGAFARFGLWVLREGDRFRHASHLLRGGRFRVAPLADRSPVGSSVYASESDAVGDWAEASELLGVLVAENGGAV